ncbi:MAG: hypothetical protein WBL63_05735 [Candidatus Acidiferrum sp.]
MANVDLRPMTLGEVLDRTFTLYRENFLLFAGITALPSLLTLLFNFGTLLIGRESTSGGSSNLPSAGVIGGIILGAVGGGLLLLLTVGVAHAATVSAVSDLYLGRPTSILDAYTRAKGSILIVIGILIMSGLATLVGMIFLIIPGIYLACRLAVSVPVAIVEQESPVASMERSMELTKDYAGQMFLLLLLVGVLEWVVSALLQAPVMFFTITAAVAKQQPSIGVTVYSYVAAFVSQVVVGPIGTISASLMYFNLRVRKEGFDIQHLLGSLDSAPRPLSLEPQ